MSRRVMARRRTSSRPASRRMCTRHSNTPSQNKRVAKASTSNAIEFLRSIQRLDISSYWKHANASEGLAGKRLSSADHLLRSRPRAHGIIFERALVLTFNLISALGAVAEIVRTVLLLQVTPPGPEAVILQRSTCCCIGLPNDTGLRVMRLPV